MAAASGSGLASCPFLLLPQAHTRPHVSTAKTCCQPRATCAQRQKRSHLTAAGMVRGRHGATGERPHEARLCTCLKCVSHLSPRHRLHRTRPLTGLRAGSSRGRGRGSSRSLGISTCGISCPGAAKQRHLPRLAAVVHFRRQTTPPHEQAADPSIEVGAPVTARRHLRKAVAEGKQQTLTVVRQSCRSCRPVHCLHPRN